MPYALRHSVNGELLAGMQTNAHGLPFYGLLLWDEEPGEEKRFDALMGSWRFRALSPEAIVKERHAAEWEQVRDLGRWKFTLLSEQEAKLGNVKLRNDPSLRAYLQDGQVTARPEG